MLRSTCRLTVISRFVQFFMVCLNVVLGQSHCMVIGSIVGVGEWLFCSRVWGVATWVALQLCLRVGLFFSSVEKRECFWSAQRVGLLYSCLSTSEVFISKWGYLSEGDDTFQGVVLLHYKWQSRDCYITCHIVPMQATLPHSKKGLDSMHVNEVRQDLGATNQIVDVHKRNHQPTRIIKLHPHDDMD